MKYNKEQNKIIFSASKHALVIAGAGSGKTTTVVGRINHLIEKENIKSEDILCLSFSRRSSKDLKKKIKYENLYISTFHKLAYDNIMNLNITEESSIGFTKDELKNISLYKNKYIKVKPLIYNTYQQHLKANNSIDFDDLLLLFYDKLKSKQLIFKYKYIFVDEFQDTNNLQYQILKELAINSSLFCVGDPDQSIYAFRGANRLVINKYLKEYKPEVFYLTSNYRSYNKIIDFANKVIDKNVFRIKKSIKGVTSIFGNIDIIKYKDIKHRDKLIMDKVNELNSNDVCLLYRVNKSSFSIIRIMDDFYIPRFELMSIHQSKGLEFDYVFIIDCNDGQIPGYIESLSQLEEERRVFFVGITRARKGLFLFYNEDMPISRFLKV